MILTRLRKLNRRQKAGMLCFTLVVVATGTEAIETATHLNSLKEWIVLIMQASATCLFICFMFAAIGVFEDMSKSQEIYSRAAYLSEQARKETADFGDTHVKVWREFNGDWLAIMNMDLFAIYFRAKYTKGDLYSFNWIPVFIGPDKTHVTPPSEA